MIFRLLALLAILLIAKADLYAPFSCEDEAADILQSIRRNYTTHSNLSPIIGYEEVVADIHGLIINPIKFPEEYTGLLEVNRGMMLFGPPGIGKTLMISHLEEELKSLNWEVWYIKPTDIYKTAYVGESEQRLQCIFNLVNNRKLANAPKKKKNIADLLFGNNALNGLGVSVKSVSIDSNGNLKEVDSPISSFSSQENSASLEDTLKAILGEGILNKSIKQDETFPKIETTRVSDEGNEKESVDRDTQNIETLQEIDDRKVLLVFDEGETIFTRDKKHNSGVVAELLHQLNDLAGAKFSVVVITNRPTIIDPSLRRRLGNQFCIRFPTSKERRQMFKEMLRNDNWTIGKDIDYKRFDENTRLFSGDDILRLVQHMVRRKVSTIKPPFRKNATPFSNKDLIEAFEHIKATSSESELVEYAEYSKQHSKACYTEFLPDPVVHLQNATSIHDEEPNLW